MKQENGWLWPQSDTECQKVAYDLSALKVALSECRNFRVAVQAGGNVGVWPKYLASCFKMVYTAEPEPDNFSCLVANVIEPNVIKLQCGFGDSNTPLDLTMVDDNCGASFFSGSGPIPVLKIDQLGLKECDLICLDIEGMELLALRGAMTTINRSRPVILLEQKGHELRYGLAGNAIADDMEQWGYRIAHRVHRDVIWVPK